MKKISFSLSALFIIFIFLFISCQKEVDLTTKPGKNVGEQKSLETLSGIVVDEFDLPVEGVTVLAHGQTYITDVDGFFIFYNLTVPGGRFILSFSKADYFPVVRSESVEGTEPALVKVQMDPITPSASNDSTSFMSDEGGTITVGALLTFTFPADIFMYESGLTYNGRVHISADYLDPTANEYHLKVYGGDQAGLDPVSGDELLLRAFVGTNVLLTDGNGNRLQINPNIGNDVTFTMQLPPALANLCPPEVEIWTFDEGLGLRANVSGNTAYKQGNEVQGTVGHFSYISCEIAYTQFAKVQGTVTNINGDPIAGISVKIGESYAITDQNGNYSRQVIAGVPVDVSIYPDYYGFPVAPQNITPYGYTTLNVTGLPVIQTISGTLVDCNNLPIAGHVVVSNFANDYATAYTTNGDFSLQFPPGNFDITGYGNNTSHTENMVAPGTFVTLHLCPPPGIGLNYAVLTGGSHNYSGYYHPFSTGAFEGYYYPTPVPGYYSILAGDSPGMNYQSIAFDGSTTGNYIIGQNANVSIEIGLPYDLVSGTLQVSNVGNPGELVEGVYEGVSSDGTQINGAFSVIRSY